MSATWPMRMLGTQHWQTAGTRESVGLLALFGPLHTDARCTLGLSCRVQLFGAGFGATNEVRIVLAGGCTSQSPVSLHDPMRATLARTNGNASEFVLPTATEWTIASHDLCWGVVGTDSAVFARLGGFFIDRLWAVGTTTGAAECYLSLPCSVQLRVEDANGAERQHDTFGVDSKTYLRIQNVTGACGAAMSQVPEVFDGMRNSSAGESPSVIGNLRTFDFGVPSPASQRCSL